MDIINFVRAVFLYASIVCYHTGDARSFSFTRSVYKASINEHFPFENESISQVVRVEPAIRVTNTDDVVRYSILSGNDDEFFRMDPSTGEVFLVRQVDREQLDTDTFSLVIQATSSETEPALARLVVNVKDINDNPPTFHPAQHVISIMENLPVEFNVLKVTATDPDLDENAAFSYSLVDSNGAFSIDPSTGWLSISNSTALDRERTAQLILWVIAVEEQPNVQTTNQSSARIDIQLMDANDNSPVFIPNNLYSFSVEAGVETGTIIGQVEAKDADQDENGRVRYSIQHPAEDDGERSKIPFSIHPETGHVIVVDTPLIKEAYTLLIEAADEPFNPSERRVSLAVVQIAVESLNKIDGEGAPRFLNNAYEFWIPADDESKDSLVGQVKAVGFLQQDAVRYSIKPNPRHQPSVPLFIDPRTGIIRMTEEKAHPSAVATYRLNVTASDGKQEALAGLTVHVLEDVVNKGRSLSSSSSTRRTTTSEPSVPRFLFNVTENSPVGSLGQINYPDRKFLEFTPLEPTAHVWQWLKLARNGSLYSRKPLDFELTGTNLSAFVTVRDQGRTIDTVQLIVTVQDVNDNAPNFQHTRFVGRINENATAGTSVLFNPAIQAIDEDGSPWNITRYSISGSHSRLFRVDPISGRITLVRSRSLDRERAPSYSLIVTASDGLMTSQAQVIIDVIDVNDNPPEIAGFVPAVTVVALERSADRQDLQNEGRIVVCADGSCSLPINLDDGSPKELPPGGRSLSTYSRFRTHLFRVLDEWVDQAERSANPALPDENEILEKAFREILHNSSIFIQVPEDFPPNNSIGSFSARDKDATARLRFSLHKDPREQQDLFDLLPSGSLMIRRIPQADKVYPLKIQLSDGQGLISEKSVAVQVLDVNNHRPTFQRSFYELILPEGDYDRTPFVTIEATDQDSGENALLTYSLNNGSHPFEIHPRSGMLLVNGKVDRERVEFFRLTVRVVDKGSPPLKNQADVVVYIADVNDNPPEFEQKLFSVALLDGTPPGAPVIRVRATDADSDVRTNANVSYRLESHQDLFGIDPSSGSMFTLAEIDQDRSREYNVLVVAEDGGTPSLSVVGVVRVTVEDRPCKDDPSPRRQQSVALDENVLTPLVLVNLTAPEGVDAVQLFLVRIEPVLPVAQTLFSLDAEEPVLWLNGSLDRETKGSAYSVHLRVQRSNGIRNNVTCPDGEELVMNIRVIDVNDNPPQFGKDSIVVVVPSDAPIGYEVIPISATDGDEGFNGLIKYSMVPDSGQKDLLLFTINPSSGLVSVTSSLDRLSGRIQHYNVLATDRNGNGLSSTLHLSIHILDRSHQVALVLATSHEELVTQSENISNLVSDVSGMEVWIKSVEPHVFEGDMVDGSMSDVVLYARNHSGQRLISSQDFSRILSSRREELDDKLSSYNLQEIRSYPQKSSLSPSNIDIGMEALEVTLLAIGAAVLLGTIVAVVCIVLSRLKLKKRTRLRPNTPVPVGRLDYHLQPLTAVASSSTGSSSIPAQKGDMYVEVPNNNDHYISPIPLMRPAESSSTHCPVCQRRKKKRCRCSCGQHLNRTTGHHNGRLIRSYSEHSGCCIHPRKSSPSGKQVRLSLPQRHSRSMSVIIEPPVVHVKDKEEGANKHHRNNRRRRSLSPNRRTHLGTRFCSSSAETYEDSLESPRSRRRAAAVLSKR